MAVSDFPPAGKMHDVWCEKVAKKGKGCTIYADRPPSCASFQCAWLAGTLPGMPSTPENRPDKVHAVVTLIGPALTIHEDIDHPGEGKAILQPAVDAHLAAGAPRSYALMRSGATMEFSGPLEARAALEIERVMRQMMGWMADVFAETRM